MDKCVYLFLTLNPIILIDIVMFIKFKIITLEYSKNKINVVIDQWHYKCAIIKYKN